MGEDKIIYHDFRPKQPTEEQATDLNTPEGQKSTRLDNLEIVARLINLLGGGDVPEGSDTFTATLRKLSGMREFLNSLEVVATAETISIRKQLVSGMSFSEMCQKILDSNEQKWKEDPSYYKALAERFSPENMANLIQLDLDDQDLNPLK